MGPTPLISSPPPDPRPLPLAPPFFVGPTPPSPLLPCSWPRRRNEPQDFSPHMGWPGHSGHVVPNHSCGPSTTHPRSLPRGLALSKPSEPLGPSSNSVTQANIYSHPLNETLQPDSNHNIIQVRISNRQRTTHLHPRQGPNKQNLIPIKLSIPPNNTSDTIPMALWNVRSLTPKTFLINDFITSHNLSCLFLTETWLTDNAATALIEASPANFSFSESHRAVKRGGGTASIVQDCFSRINILFDDFTTFEYHAILLKCKPKILAVTVYRPEHDASFLDEFTEFLSLLHTQHDQIILTGDFNIHVDNPFDPIAKDFLNLLDSMGFTQHVSGPTHKKGHTLDLVITKNLTTSITSIIPLLFPITLVYSSTSKSTK